MPEVDKSVGLNLKGVCLAASWCGDAKDVGAGVGYPGVGYGGVADLA